MLRLLVIIFFMIACAQEGSAQSEIPPAWQVDNKDLYRAKPRKKRPRPWYLPRVAVGMGINVPEAVQVETYLLFGKYVGLRFFYTPPLPLNIRIEMPADVISAKNSIGVAHPDYNIRMKATYGEHYGTELRVFPWGRSFFWSAGGSFRQVRLRGEAKSPLLVCSLIEAAKEPPCGNEDAAIRTETELEIKLDAMSTALLARSSVGWMWDIGRTGYLTFEMGASKPMRVHRGIDVEANADVPGDDDDEVIRGALAEVKADSEGDLRSKAAKELRPVESQVLPILGLSVGFRF